MKQSSSTAGDVSRRGALRSGGPNVAHKWSDLAHELPYFMLSVDRAGTILDVNRRIAQSDFDSTVGRNISDYAPPADARNLLDAVRRVLRTGHRKVLEIRGLGPDGPNSAWYETRIFAPKKDRGPRLTAIIVAVDVTDRKRVEEALKQSEAKYRAIFEHAADSIMLIGVADQMVKEFNTRAHKNLGYTRLEFAKLTVQDIDASENAKEIMKRLRRIAGGSPGTFMTKHRTKSGEIRDVHVNAQLFTMWDTKYVMAICRDVTELRRAQTGLKESEALLKQQKKDLQDKNVALHEILAQIETEKLQIRKQITANAEKLLMPVLKQLRKEALGPQLRYVDLLEQNINALTSDFGVQIQPFVSGLTPREVEICDMIRAGMSTKEIAGLLGISQRTIDTHRNRIRKKLGIAQKDTSLATYLQSL